MAAGPCGEGRVVLVTGGARGIGAGIVRAFVENGAKVVFCDKNEASGQALAEELRSAQPPAGAAFIRCDVTREGEVEALISEILQRFGRLDCVVNNAGHHPPEETLEEISPQAFRELLELNLLAVYSVSKFALPLLRQNQGSIINISSLVGAIGQRKAASYVATKGAVTALTKALALDESQYGVRVNCISPGNIWTPLWTELAATTPDPAATPLGRMGRPDEVGAAAVFLAFRASFCTGVDLPVTGGAELGYGRRGPPAPRGAPTSSARS